MSSKYCKAINATIANNTSESDAIDVSSFKFLAVEIPTAACGLVTATVSVYLSGSDESDGTFMPLKLDGTANIASGETGHSIATVDRFIPNFIKVVLADATATAAGFACRVHAFY